MFADLFVPVFVRLGGSSSGGDVDFGLWVLCDE